jgi:hypothetical protein|nr:MAG TPA: hypothetical protein [Caudoviricetes sp.]
MTLKELNVHFKVFKWENIYKLHSLEIGGRSVFKYLCSVEKHGNKFNVVGYNKTNSIDEFKKQVYDYISKLEYDSDYFDPSRREGYREYLFVHDYLTGLGFEDGHFWRSPYVGDYVYKPKDIYGGQTTIIELSFRGLNINRGYNKEEVVIILHGSDSWVEVKVRRNMKNIQEGIDSLLKPLLLAEGAKNIKTADKLEIVIKDITINSISGFDIYSADYRKKLKEKLLEIIEKL